MSIPKPEGSEIILRSEKKIETLEQLARDLARSVESVRQQTLAQTNERIEALEQKARDLAQRVETTRKQTLLQSENKTEVLEQNARDQAEFAEARDKQTRTESETEIEALVQRARDLAASVEAVREETLLHSESEIATLGKKARELAVSMEAVREETLLHSDTEIAALGQQNQELESFSYSVSHDLRSPLRSILGFSRILLEDHADQLPAEVQEYLQDIHRNAVRMGHLIDDLLTFSRLSRQDLKTRTVAPVEMINQALEELRPGREGRNVEIAIGELLPCQADPALLKQVWVNLLANALKYSRKREAARIEVGCRLEGEECVYFVRDNGIGFDMKYAGKLFGVFQRMHTAAEYEGTGVGLAIVQRIIQRHGGRIWAESALNQGAMFSFTIPRQATH